MAFDAGPSAAMSGRPSRLPLGGVNRLREGEQGKRTEKYGGNKSENQMRAWPAITRVASSEHPEEGDHSRHGAVQNPAAPALREQHAPAATPAECLGAA